jgi:hypothetical protein
MDHDLQEFYTRMGLARDPLGSCRVHLDPESPLSFLARIPNNPNLTKEMCKTGLPSLITDLNFQIKICFRKDSITYLTRCKINHKKCAKLNISFKFLKSFLLICLILLPRVYLVRTTTHYAC